ncbi:MAG TPA: TonB-dependent receptor [Gemmatimonadaceae bacterium]|nr:TonB-dependent receptor [Gemmatimonadaceae bacterium]
MHQPGPRRCRSSFVALAAVLLGGLALAPTAQAQTGRLTGTVRSARGAPVEAASVTAANEATGASRRATTRPDGSYTVGDLAPGAYTVTVAAVGHRRAVHRAVQVTGTPTTLDVALEAAPLEAVVVTATLREEELTAVPFSIAAPTARTLRERGADNIEAIAANVAGLSVQNLGPGQSQVAIRGASAGQIARDQPGVKEQVGVYLDETPVSLSLFTPDLDLFDVARVEVLRGPQGTLFGSGSLSGTARYITNQPELGVRSTFGELGGSWVDGGNGGAVAKLGANVPIGSRAAGRVAAYHNQLAGYMGAVQPDFSLDKDVNTGRRSGVRAALRWEPAEGVSITPRFVWQSVRMDGWNRIDDYNILANPFTTSRPPVTLGEREQFTQLEEAFDDDFVLGDLNVRWDFAGMNLTSVTTYNWRDILVVRDAGALTSSITGGSLGLPENVYTLDSPLNDSTRVRGWTQELRLAGTAGRSKWLVGAFHAQNQRDYSQILDVAGFEDLSGIPTEGLRAPRDVLFFSDLSYDLTQTALFGEGTLNLTEQLDLTAGLRYYRFDEERDQVFDGIFANDNTGESIVSVPGDTKADGIAPRFIASFRATPTLTFNAQVAGGFRLGGINDPLNEPLCSAQDLVTFSGRDSWKDETAWNYEVGGKSQFAGGRASLNASLFYMDIRDLQLIVTAGTCSSRLVFNVPKSRSQGVELELTASPTDALDLSLSASYNDAELRSTLTTTDSMGVTSVISGIEAGNRLPSVPKFQGAAAGTYRWRLGPRSLASFTGTVQHVGSRLTQIDDHQPGIGTVDLTTLPNTIGGPLTASTFTFDPEMPAYTLVNLRLGVARLNWEVALFANNVTNERAFLALDRERGLLARVGYLTNPPRTFGLTAAFQY